MDIQPISNNKFIVGLTYDEMKDLDITYDDMDYSNIETRRVIWTILDTVRRDTGRDVDPSGNLMIEAAPDTDGGCLLMFTVAIYEFENLDNLLDFMRFLPDNSRRIFTKESKYRLEIPTETANGLQRILNEYAKFVGKSKLAAAHTYEHWREL